MENKTFLGATEVAQALGMSKSYGYKVIETLNDELREKGYAIIQGKVSRRYFEEKYYGLILNDESLEMVV